MNRFFFIKKCNLRAQNILSNPFLSEIGIVYLGPNGTAVQQSNFGNKTRVDSSPFEINLNPFDNTLAMNEVWLANAKTRQRNVWGQRDLTQPLLGQLSPAYGLSHYQPTSFDLLALTNPQFMQAEIPQTGFQYAVLDLDGSQFMLLVDTAYAGKLNEALGGI